jgi:hypothetical protein
MIAMQSIDLCLPQKYSLCFLLKGGKECLDSASVFEINFFSSQERLQKLRETPLFRDRGLHYSLNEEETIVQTKRKALSLSCGQKPTNT